MNSSDTSTVIRLRCFSFKLIFATTQPNAQDSVSTNSEISTISSSVPTTTPVPADTLIQYTMAAGRKATPEYISPIRYTPISRAPMMALTGIGMLNSKSLSLARYSPA